MMQKNHAFDKKQLKITKEQTFGKIYNFLKSSNQIFGPFLGVLGATASTLFINRYKITFCLYQLILPVFEKNFS